MMANLDEDEKKIAKEFRDEKKKIEPDNIFTKQLNELDSKKEELILDLLNQKEKQIYFLDQFYLEGKDLFGYGFKLNGREVVILSDGRILRNTEEKFKDKTIGENQIKEVLDYVGYIGDIAPIISNEAIKRFYIKKERNHLINPKELFKSIKDKLIYYMDFEEEIAYVLSCWIIGTYCYQLFSWFPHILINAPSGSGKSKCLKLIQYLSFRGFDIGASAGVSPAQIFRTLEGNRGTICFDEFEQQEQNSNNSETQRLVTQILNASCDRDAYVIRCEQINKKWISMKFPIYCPKVCANISGINPTSLSRFIPFKWLKTLGEKGKRKPDRIQTEKKSFDPIREDIYLLILERFKEIKYIYENLDLENINNRDVDNWLPLYSIAEFIDLCDGEDLKIKEKLDLYFKNYKSLEIEINDNTDEFFRILYENAPEEERFLQSKEIVTNYSEIQNLFSYLKSPAHKVGCILTLYKFKTNNRAGGVKKYIISKSLVKEILDRYYPNTEIITPNNTNNT